MASVLTQTLLQQAKLMARVAMTAMKYDYFGVPFKGGGDLLDGVVEFFGVGKLHQLDLQMIEDFSNEGWLSWHEAREAMVGMCYDRVRWHLQEMTECEDVSEGTVSEKLTELMDNEVSLEVWRKRHPNVWEMASLAGASVLARNSLHWGFYRVGAGCFKAGVRGKDLTVGKLRDAGYLVGVEGKYITAMKA